MGAVSKFSLPISDCGSEMPFTKERIFQDTGP